MTNKELKDRTQKFSLEIIRFTEELPKTKTCEVIGRQLLRSACSVGANYRAALRAQSTLHFISKISIVEEEADESLYWLELLYLAGVDKTEYMKTLMKEADELTAIFTSTRKTAKINEYSKKNRS